MALNQGGRVRAASYVSLSPTDSDRYEIVLQGERNFTEAIRNRPANARRMFLFDRLAVADQRAPFDMRDILIPDIEDNQAAPLSSGVVIRSGGARK